ncbi:hypothetical protein E2C01_037090 [Portunus trituberculatus]|uniref:Uncharacterized protein n=1 Tax=Portunus trituberculatus TaxID=210409 RepID=A0A5B7FAG9_PORTR|nr:hypothetical protein [Portunus trituberculatus]
MFLIPSTSHSSRASLSDRLPSSFQFPRCQSPQASATITKTTLACPLRSDVDPAVRRPGLNLPLPPPLPPPPSQPLLRCQSPLRLVTSKKTGQFT